jgi:pimeloyl-ACP methyl ester carboxylesterase
MHITHHDVTLHYEDLGTGVPLVLLAAFPFDGRMWREQVGLADVARLIVPDYRGTGRSAVAAGPSTMAVLAEDVIAILDALGLPRAVIAGCSVGCYVAFALYERFPERVRGLVLCDTRPEADNPEQQERRRKTVDGLLTQGTGILRDRVNDLFAPATLADRPELVAMMQAQALEQPAEGLANLTLGMAARPDRTALLPGIAVPTLVVCGEHDKVSPPAGMRAMAAQIPGARFVVIPDAGHLSPLEQPDLVNAAIREFLVGMTG